MNTYRVNITGTYHVELYIEAESSDEAENKVADNLDIVSIEELVAHYGLRERDILSIAADTTPVNN
jgi:predicted Zn-dependent protease with MMP-like domain